MIDLSTEAYPGAGPHPRYPNLPRGEAFDPEILGPWAHQRQAARDRLLLELEAEDLSSRARQIVLASIEAFDAHTHADVEWVNGYVAARCAANLRVSKLDSSAYARRVGDGTFDEGYVVGLTEAARRMESYAPELAEDLLREAATDDQPNAANPWATEAPACPSCTTAKWVLFYDVHATTGRWICIHPNHEGPDRFDAEDVR